MIDGWIVVREEKHIDMKFWVCLNKDDALKIANDVTNYWKEKYDPNPEDVDTELYESLIFNFNADDMFWVYVQPQKINEIGEAENTE
jgi:hypothetical protein